MNTVGLSQSKPKPPILVSAGFLILVVILTSAVATQYVAYKFSYHPALGGAIYAHLYAPWRWVEWAFQFYGRAPSVFMQAGWGVVFGLGVGILGYLVFWAKNRGLTAIKDLHGSAHWATEEEIEQTGLLPARKKLFSQKKNHIGVYIGAWEHRGVTRYLKHNGPEHVLAFAPTRSGKGVGLIIPTLLSWQESTVVYDLKGENWALTAGWRKSAGQTVLAFDPTDSEGRGVGYNALEEVRIKTDHEIADAQNIVQQIVDPDGKGLESHWDKTSFMFLVGAILYTIYECASRKPASLTDVANTLSNDAGIDQLYARMKANKFGANGTCHPVIAKSAIDMLEKEPRERGSVLSTAKTFFSLYSDPTVSKNISRSGFRISDLMNANTPVSLYIIVDPSDKTRLKPLIRLILTQIVRNLTTRLKFENGVAIKGYKYRLLLMLDEFPTLGKLPIFEDALAHIAGYGMKAYLITQDIAQLTGAYGPNESIVSNCHVRIAYAPNKVETAELLSKMTGSSTIIKRQVTTSGSRMGPLLGQASVTLSEHQRPLLTTDECMRLPGAKKDADGKITEPGHMLVFASGHAPIYGRQILFFQDRTFANRSKIPYPAKSDSIR